MPQYVVGRQGLYLYTVQHLAVDRARSQWLFGILAIFATHAILRNSELRMPTRNVNLTDELERLVQAKVKSGRYENASEVMRAALRALEREDEEHQAKLSALRAAIDEGDASGVADDNVFARVREKLNRSTSRP